MLNESLALAEYYLQQALAFLEKEKNIIVNLEGEEKGLTEKVNEYLYEDSGSYTASMWTSRPAPTPSSLTSTSAARTGAGLSTLLPNTNASRSSTSCRPKMSLTSRYTTLSLLIRLKPTHNWGTRRRHMNACSCWPPTSTTPSRPRSAPSVPITEVLFSTCRPRLPINN